MKKLTLEPLVSVVLPVYNGQPYLGEAIASILSQTLKDFELIIINDGSKDDSDAAIRSFDDPRIRYYPQANQGLAATLNLAVKQARGKYIARQDQDDISVPNRLEQQVAFLEGNPKVGIVGSWARIIVGKTPVDRELKHPVGNTEMQFMALFDSPLVHPSVMIRREVFDVVGFYSTDPQRQPPEDYEFWSRVVQYYELANIPEYLLTYREVEGSMSRAPSKAFIDKVIMISAENIARATGRSIRDRRVRALAELVRRPARASASKRAVIAFLYEIAAQSGKTTELQKLARYYEGLVKQHYLHSELYKAARTVKTTMKRALSPKRTS